MKGQFLIEYRGDLVENVVEEDQFDGETHQVSLSMWLGENNQNLDIGNEQVSTLENELTCLLEMGKCRKTKKMMC